MFVEAMAREVEADSRQPTFKFYHLRGLHPPLHMNESCQPERMAFNRPNFKRQAKGELKLMSSFVSLLKRSGAFRNSLIFIVGDHGPGNWGLCDINLGILGRASSTALPVPGLLEIKASALPLMLVKPANDPGKKPLLISDAPVGLGDIPATAAAAVGLKADFPGRPLFSVKAAEDRRRRFLYHEGFASDKQGYLEAIQEYWVRGFSWLDESWHIASNKYLPSWKNHGAKSVLGNSQ
jgi:arylsulfatase A-like enzyme